MDQSGRGLVSIITAVRMTTMTARAMFTMIPVWVLDDNARTPHTHARDILGGHRHTVPIGLARVVPAAVRVHDLLMGLNVYRHGLRVPVLGLLHVRVAVSTSRDGVCRAGRVMHSRTLVRKHKCLGGRLRNNGGG